jgi:hypothetical protein
MSKVLTAATLLASSGLVAASTPCDYTLEDSVAVGIANEIELILSVSFHSASCI